MRCIQGETVRYREGNRTLHYSQMMPRVVLFASCVYTRENCILLICSALCFVLFFSERIMCVIYPSIISREMEDKEEEKKNRLDFMSLEVQFPGNRLCACQLPFLHNKLLVLLSLQETLPAKGFLTEEKTTSGLVICYSVNRISGEMDLLACPLQRSEGQPRAWRCHLQRNAFVNTQL